MACESRYALPRLEAGLSAASLSNRGMVRSQGGAVACACGGGAVLGDVGWQGREGRRGWRGECACCIM